ncbi:tRNA-intron endonuclease [Halovenus aranensis]|uniref:tRNA-splicing endonuclease n=1 Tax=Halovenus aranensis TaxID=890420 RepID=A0A1G8VPJ5_9EURY|nr:tRNA-intron lyase [Halovenus aranensis]SDJ68006.1 tRNA-intron endonuclease [Halovenus aranensis]
MQLTFDGETVRGGNEARERFYDARGYGRPHDGGLELAPVEAGHLLFRGDVTTVRDDRDDSGEGIGFESLLASRAVSEVDFFVYKELRDRGFYLSPTDSADVTDFIVYPRGQGPWDDAVAYRVTTLSERATIDAGTLQAIARGIDAEEDEASTGVLAVVDEESEVTYLELDVPTLSGSTYHDIPSFEGDLLSDRVLVPEPPAALHDRAFYGQRLDRDDDRVQLSLVEAAYLSSRGDLAVGVEDVADADAIVDRGREVEGERFDRRLRVYDALRSAGIVPKTGFKFGADFRTYADVDSVDDLGHSEFLVRALPADHSFVPRDLSLDVRLAHGVRKRMLFALTVQGGIDWLSAERLTP